MNYEDDWHLARLLSLLLYAVVVILGSILVAIAVTTYGFGRELYPGQYAQVDPELKQWFDQQLIPPGNLNAGIRCCDESDGTHSEEVRIGGHYRTRFQYIVRGEAHESGWMDVPDSTVIHGGTNPTGGPVVWYWLDNAKGGNPVVNIKCFKPSTDA
jgi:hypothetical protein